MGSRQTPPATNMKITSCMLALIGLSTVSSTVIVAVPTVTVTASLSSTLAALGLLKLGAAKLLAITRSKRSTGKDEIYQDVSKLEDQQCVRRFLCDVASGELTAPEYLSTVETLKAENLNLLIGSAELPYAEAVKYGAKVKSLKQCESKYVCAQSGQQILLAAGLQGA